MHDTYDHTMYPNCCRAQLSETRSRHQVQEQLQPRHHHARGIIQLVQIRHARVLVLRVQTLEGHHITVGRLQLETTLALISEQGLSRIRLVHRLQHALVDERKVHLPRSRLVHIAVHKRLDVDRVIHVQLLLLFQNFFKGDVLERRFLFRDAVRIWREKELAHASSSTLCFAAIAPFESRTAVL